MLDIYQTLEISEILNEINKYSKCESNKLRIASLKMLSSFEAIKKDLTNVSEMMSLIIRHGELPIDVSFSLEKFVSIANKDGLLTIDELSHIVHDIELSHSLMHYFGRVENHLYPNIIALSNRLDSLLELEKSIKKVISPSLTIFDDASPELFSIRKKINQLENNLRFETSSLLKQFKDYLSDYSVSIRNDHFVLSVKTSFKNKVSGVIHDISSSGQTTFIEPSSLVDLSNELYVLRVSEREEINHLLKMLTQEVNNYGEIILNNNQIIAELDFIQAKSIYGINHDANVVHFVNDKKIIDLKEARHPLIDKSKVVSNNFYFDENCTMIIISGPNAGGKSVALKTLGLMIMMSQMGLPILVKEGSTISMFPRIYASIGDSQSLSDNLSTFAAHISNLSTITHFVKENDLVLLDELGTGTSPKEGSAIALAVCDFLREKKCFSLISSHFDELKEYAYSYENVKNAMMVFDDKKLLPTYILKVGLPGRSYGLEMAKRYHLDEDIIENAKKRLNKNKNRSINDVIDKLNKTLKENEAILEDTKKRSLQLEKKEKDVDYQLKNLNKKKENLLEDVELEKEKLLEDAKKQISEVLKVLSKPKYNQVELVSAKKDLDNLFKVDVVQDETFLLGDNVEIPDLGIIGKIKAIKGKKVTLISQEGMSFNTSLDKITHSNRPIINRFKTQNNIDEIATSKGDLKMELNIIGERVQDGIIILAKYLDDALLRGFPSVRIIHGMGSGALRKGVWDYLAKCDFVKEYHYGGQFDGGSGATIVTFK
ncbi:MAG: Smr/MutS family protein [Bacilli bacterium]|nr:Smr/MutS family protein [Bacilli bacterium]